MVDFDSVLRPGFCFPHRAPTSGPRKGVKNKEFKITYKIIIYYDNLKKTNENNHTFNSY